MTALQVLAASAAGVALFVGGCASERHREIPASAQMSVEGDGRLTFIAPEDGHVYIYDVDEDRMVHQGIVQEGDTVLINPDGDRVTLDGVTVAEKDAVDAGHQHRIFFEEETLPGTIAVPAGSRIEVDRQPAPETKIRIEESEQPETRIDVQTDDQPDTRIDVNTDDADTQIKVD